MNLATLQDRIMALEHELKGMPITYANQYWIFDKLNYLKEEILDEYKSKSGLYNSINFPDNIKYMDNRMRNEVITLYENLIYIDKLTDKVERIFNEQNQNIQ